MRNLRVALLALALVIAVAAAVSAQTTCAPVPTAPACASPAPVCPPTPVCPPAPTCAPVCAPACPSQPAASVPCGAGAGPVNELANIGPSAGYDKRYMEVQYQLHSEIIALANQGAQQAADPSLRKFSQKLIKERSDMNAKLAQWYPMQIPGGVLTATPLTTTATPLASLCGADFDREYAAELINVMQQSYLAANDGAAKLTYPPLKGQANIVKRTTYNEVQALRNWQVTGKLEKP